MNNGCSFIIMSRGIKWMLVINNFIYIIQDKMFIKLTYSDYYNEQLNIRAVSSNRV